jgi:hypothetical protein
MVGQNNILWNASEYASGLEAVRPPKWFQVEPHFVHASSYPPKLVLSLSTNFQDLLSQNKTSMQTKTRLIMIEH